MRVSFPRLHLRQAVVHHVNPKKVDDFLRRGEVGIIALLKMLRPEKEGGINQKERTLRKQIWDKILAHSFGEGKNIRILDKDRLPYEGRFEHIKSLGHVVLKGRLSKEGKLEAGKVFTKFDRYGHAEYLLEMNEGFPVRILLLNDYSAFEFFPIIDNKTGKIVDVHRGKIKREKLIEFGDITTYTYLSQGEGRLFLGGHRPGIDGKSAEERRSWVKFVNNPDEKVRVIVRDGIIHRCTSLESDLDVEFALVWDKKQRRYVSSFWGKMFENEFNKLNENNEIHNLCLSRDGSLYLGARHWMDFGPKYSYKKVRITDIRNPSGGQAFVIEAGVVEEGKVLAKKKLSLIYGVPDNSPAESFEKAALFNVFEKWSADKIVRPGGIKLNTYIISGIHTNADGLLEVNGYLGRFKYFAGAEVEIKVIDGKPAFIKFLADKDGSPILDRENNPLIIDVRQNNGENGIKQQILAHSKLFYERKVRALKRLFDEGLRLVEGGKRDEAKLLFKKVIRIIRKTTVPGPEMKGMEEKAKRYFARKVKSVRPKPPKPPKLVRELKPKPKPKPVPPAVAVEAKPVSQTEKFSEQIIGLIEALQRKGATLDWIARVSGISLKRISVIMEGIGGTEDEMLKIRGAYIKFVVKKMDRRA